MPGRRWEAALRERPYPGTLTLTDGDSGTDPLTASTCKRRASSALTALRVRRISVILELPSPAFWLSARSICKNVVQANIAFLAGVIVRRVARNTIWIAGRTGAGPCR